MSLLQLMMRPWVEFNPKDYEHRKWYAEYVRTKSWSHCPVRFVDPNDCGNLAMSMQRTLLEYYSKQEFKSSPKRVKKVEKTVDSIEV
ncbi:MAG: hypothetical protein ACKOD7_03505 [Polynucleobacter victoriensis]